MKVSGHAQVSFLQFVAVQPSSSGAQALRRVKRYVQWTDIQANARLQEFFWVRALFCVHPRRVPRTATPKTQRVRCSPGAPAGYYVCSRQRVSFVVVEQRRCTARRTLDRTSAAVQAQWRYTLFRRPPAGLGSATLLRPFRHLLLYRSWTTWMHARWLWRTLDSRHLACRPSRFGVAKLQTKAPLLAKGRLY